MHIVQVSIRNFRSILEATLSCDSITALVGRNGSGKSAFLSALDLFYNSSARVTEDDFYAADTANDIEIEITFGGLHQKAMDLFSLYIENAQLTIVKVFSATHGSPSGNYHGIRLQNPDFASVGNAGGKLAIRQAYGLLRKRPDYASLPAAKSADAALTALADWEKDNPTRCSRQRDDGQFFGFKQVAEGYLGRYTRFVHIPAVRDAQEDATDSKGSAVTEILDLVVRSALADRQELADFKQRTQDEYRLIMNPKGLTELGDLESNLSSTLQSFVSEAGVQLEWSDHEQIHIPMPQAQVTLQEDGYKSTVARTGHGLQRAFIIAMFQYLAAARQVDTRPGRADTSDLPNLVFAIEEPELYQHPSRQRHLASVLSRLASGTIPGVSQRTQVIYTTHSPLLISLDRFGQIRVVRKISHDNDRPKITQVKRADMDQVAHELWCATRPQQDRYTAETLRPRLQAIMTPWMNEGFFANVVVLVEGEDDRAAILGAASTMGHDFDSMGISLIPCYGKNSLDRPLVVFRQLGIPVFVVWDGDYGRKDANEINRYILRLLGHREEDWPDFVRESCACFSVTLEKTLQDELGDELFEELLSKAKSEFGITKKERALKNVAVIQRVLAGAASRGNSSESLNNIVMSIVALRNEPVPSDG